MDDQPHHAGSLQHWLDLSQLPGLGPQQLKSLHQLTLPAQNLAALTEVELVEAGFSAAFFRQLQTVLENKAADQIRRQREQCLDWSVATGQHLLSYASPAYPPLLYEITEPPPLLFVRGQVNRLALPQLGIVGSRSPTPDGCKNARQFAAELSCAGYQITSGLAFGIDTQSHLGALDKNGVTIAVLGAGLNQIYPAQNAKLAATIAETGALVSEFMPDMEARPGNFPRRNRIISGLSHGVLVVEAAKRSGSLITARLAAEQGREVFVLPGSIHNPMARGCHQLIRQGAKLVETVADILEELPALLTWEAGRQVNTDSNESPAITTLPLAAEIRQLLGHIAYDPVSVDMLVARSGMELPAVYGYLVELELQGLIEVHAGTYVLSAVQANAKIQT